VGAAAAAPGSRAPARRAATPDWLLTDAKGLFDSACRHAWAVDGAPGIVYTLDWHDRPVVRERLHWTHAEASAAAQALLKRTGEPHYEPGTGASGTLRNPFHRPLHGSWHHELDPHNQPGSKSGVASPTCTTPGKVLLPALPWHRAWPVHWAGRYVTKR
jgi:mannose/cellobiose epimerase-like protein (N-acyl-D-glucosamine 2-epimerase family)